jgi:heme exporter protein A
MEAPRLVATDLACRRGDRLLFRGLSLALGAGSALQVTGPNGTGKSSLLRILAGLLRPFAGDVTRAGAVALLDERTALDEHKSLGQALQFWTGIDAAKEADLAELGLAELGQVPVRYLSTGQRKRAAIARMLGQDAPIWLLDEPLNGLDVAAVKLFEGLVAGHCAKGGIAVIASHQPIGIAGLSSLALAEFLPAPVE